MDNQTDFVQDNQQQAQAAQQAQDFQQQQPQKAKGRGGLIALAVIGLLVGAGGAGFGVYTMTQKNDTKPANLAVKIEKADGSIVELETDQIKKSEDGATITITDSTNSPITKNSPFIADGYFYVPEWGWKYKLPEDLTGFGYAVDYDEAHVGYDLPFIGFTAVQKSDLVEDAQAQYYDSILSCSIVEVNKSQKEKNSYGLGEFDKEIGDYKVRISISSSSHCEYNTNINAVQQKLVKMFQNPEEI